MVSIAGFLSVSLYLLYASFAKRTVPLALSLFCNILMYLHCMRSCYNIRIGDERRSVMSRQKSISRRRQRPPTQSIRRRKKTNNESALHFFLFALGVFLILDRK